MAKSSFLPSSIWDCPFMLYCFSKVAELLEITLLDFLLQNIHSFELIAILSEVANILEGTLLDFLYQKVLSFDLMPYLAKKWRFCRSLDLPFEVVHSFDLLFILGKEAQILQGHSPWFSPLECTQFWLNLPNSVKKLRFCILSLIFSFRMYTVGYNKFDFF